MKKFLIFCCSLFLSLIAYAENSENPEKGTTIILKGKSTGQSQFPRMPSYSPIYCVLNGNAVTVYSEFEAYGEIILLDEGTGEVFLNDYAELSGGCSFIIPEQGGVLSLYVVIGDATYWTTL